LIALRRENGARADGADAAGQRHLLGE
jgi:hypothetical protein